MNPRLVLVTVPHLAEVRHLAEVILEKRLAACVTLVPGVESHYWWQGQRETAQEILLVIKSRVERWEELGRVIQAHHSYACPEIIALAPEEIAPEYRAWWEKECPWPP